MDLLSAVQTINTLLSTTQPDTFSSSWIHKHAPHVYRFVRNNLRTEYGGIDWDAFTRSLDRKMQPRWQASHRGRPATCVRGRNAVEILLHTYHDKLYTFLSPLNMPDEQVRDVISIALVRIAQRGNEIAKGEFMKLIRFTVDAWIEQCPELSSWAGRDDQLRERIECCIRRYRYSGTFIGYLYKSLEYAGRGLRPVVAYSLDDPWSLRNTRT